VLGGRCGLGARSVLVRAPRAARRRLLRDAGGVRESDDARTTVAASSFTLNSLDGSPVASAERSAVVDLLSSRLTAEFHLKSHPVYKAQKAQKVSLASESTPRRTWKSN
jgi:hypothetical protein